MNFKNNGVVNTEHDLILYSENGDQIDTEPDTYEVNLKVGDNTHICVGTDGIWPSISDLGSTYSIVLRVDDYHTGFREVDHYTGNTP